MHSIKVQPHRHRDSYGAGTTIQPSQAADPLRTCIELDAGYGAFGYMNMNAVRGLSGEGGSHSIRNNVLHFDPLTVMPLPRSRYSPKQFEFNFFVCTKLYYAHAGILDFFLRGWHVGGFGLDQ